MIHWMEGGG